MKVREVYEQVCSGKDIRASLIMLKQEIKDADQKRAFVYLLGGDFTVLTKLLEHEDAKTRKNAALILGELECDDIVADLWKAYEAEAQLFVKSSYLKSIFNYQYKEYLPKIKERLEKIALYEGQPNETKHLREESAALQKLILKYEKPCKHSFKNSEKEYEIILITNREQREATREQIEGKSALIGAGVKVKTSDVKQLMCIRTFTEMLFPVPGVSLLSEDPELAAKELAAGGVFSFLESMHKGDGAFYFRTELRGRMPLDKRSVFVKKFSAVLSAETARALVNSSSDYEIELRLLEKKDGGYVPLIKLFTLKDNRFQYRKEVVSSSIAPSNAALIMKLAEEWLVEGAQVLDPFCGVGTMLIERNALKEANPMYGIDIYEEAILKARENAGRADVIINFINRNILDFKHEYLFDEIVSNLPVVTRTKGAAEITELYEAFFKRVPDILKADGILLLYTKEQSILQHCLKKYGFIIEIKKWLINEREGSTAYLLRNLT